MRKMMVFLCLLGLPIFVKADVALSGFPVSLFY